MTGTMPAPDYENAKHGVRLWCGDALTVLSQLPDGCAQTCVTSPPYWGLRDYKKCKCAFNSAPNPNCAICGGSGFIPGMEDMIGMEKTPDEYLAKLIAVFQEVRRVLKADGTLWLNLGDCYASDDKWGGRSGGKHVKAIHDQPIGRMKRVTGLKSKDLVGMPWLVAFALRADGWYLRSDIIWSKPNPMPESVTDRPTKAHEYLFLLSKSAKYYYDADAIAEQSIDPESLRGRGKRNGDAFTRSDANGKARTRVGFSRLEGVVYESRNKRSVWTVATKGFSGAHFATFPPDLIEPCIKAGCPAGGIVIDPFNGSGTTGEVSIKHWRGYIGIDANRQYIKKLAIPRIEQAIAEVENDMFGPNLDAPALAQGELL